MWTATMLRCRCQCEGLSMECEQLRLCVVLLLFEERETSWMQVGLTYLSACGS